MTHKKQAVLEEVELLPDECLDELVEFIQVLKRRFPSLNLETAYASEAVLVRDWLSPEEDEAWRDL